MNLRRLVKPLVMDTCVLGVLTVALVYGLTRSGLLIVGLAGLGIICIAVGGGTAGQVTSGQSGYGEYGEVGTPVDDTGIWSGVSPDAPFQVRLFFYGVGLVLWSLIVLRLFSSNLQ
ncbi:uncharacterized protein Nmag_3459 [Natrialba magadii ATCC 43099]|uniref:DUF8070 domain-containing protein n=2 Tax=Natrialba magadii (strain ATCC 43099 / DSM 3394 / CCM 3739 / CIP 104546 / IAM 13178 / JCM 8861 / NBRC 102185 / NCIMB 2190 / MS3) TaxID=547559 RepID=D3STE2_NATMM|nr:uncharacterized protein Nmag_3459 [Natrialba magadii ATCC 43099]